MQTRSSTRSSSSQTNRSLSSKNEEAGARIADNAQHEIAKMLAKYPEEKLAEQSKGSGDSTDVEEINALEPKVKMGKVVKKTPPKRGKTTKKTSPRASGKTTGKIIRKHTKKPSNGGHESLVRNEDAVAAILAGVDQEIVDSASILLMMAGCDSMLVRIESLSYFIICFTHIWYAAT